VVNETEETTGMSRYRYWGRWASTDISLFLAKAGSRTVASKVQTGDYSSSTQQPVKIWIQRPINYLNNEVFEQLVEFYYILVW